MAEYIIKEVALNELGELIWLCREALPNENGHHYVTDKELLICYEHLRRTSPADVAPVVHGRWIDRATEFCYRCSVCEEYTTQELPNLLYHYCPNCGARMDEVTE